MNETFETILQIFERCTKASNLHSTVCFLMFYFLDNYFDSF